MGLRRVEILQLGRARGCGGLRGVVMLPCRLIGTRWACPSPWWAARRFAVACLSRWEEQEGILSEAEDVLRDVRRTRNNAGAPWSLGFGHGFSSHSRVGGVACLLGRGISLGSPRRRGAAMVAQAAWLVGLEMSPVTEWSASRRWGALRDASGMVAGGTACRPGRGRRNGEKTGRTPRRENRVEGGTRIVGMARQASLGDARQLRWAPEGRV